MKRIYFVFLCSLLLCGQEVSARSVDTASFIRHGFSAALTGGIHQYIVQDPDIKTRPGLDVGIEISYVYHMNAHWAFEVGLGFERMGGLLKDSRIQNEYYTTDAEGEDFFYRATFDNYSENIRNFGVRIPLKVRYEKANFYGAIGPYIYIPFNTLAHARADKFMSEGFYPNYDQWFQDVAGMGFYTLEPFDRKEAVKNRISCGVYLELGYKTPVNKTTMLYVGVYGGYGGDLSASKNEMLYLARYNPAKPEEVLYQSLASTVHRLDNYYAGIKIRLELDLSK